MQSNPALESAILANPGLKEENADAYMVYADWLQGQGEPRGELIALQAAGTGAERLRKIPKQLVANQLRVEDDPEYRFVCVGE